MLMINEDFLGIGLHTCGSASDYKYIVEKSNEKFERVMGPFLDHIPDKFKPSNSNSNYSSEKSNSGLTKDDKDYLMGVIKSMQQVIEIQNSIIKNNQMKNVIDAEPIDITENEETVIDIEPIEITENEDKKSKIEFSNDDIELITKEIIKGTRNIINNIVKNLNK